MMRLKKILSDASKNGRSRRNILSIQITILGWLVELLGFLTLATGSFILGHENSKVTMMMQVITMIWYAIFLPCTILVNSSEVKDRINKEIGVNCIKLYSICSDLRLIQLQMTKMMAVQMKQSITNIDIKKNNLETYVRCQKHQRIKNFIPFGTFSVPIAYNG